jgi:hypothetical protein
MDSGVGEVPFRKIRAILLDLRREPAWKNYLQWLENIGLTTPSTKLPTVL